MAFFTVIIPLYNKENYVENTLKSILKQSFTDFEIIIVNDCSTDKSVAKITPFLSDKIQLIHHKTNKGLSAARNTGIKNASANYITFLDADDLWKPNFLETIHNLINKFPEAKIFATNYEEIYGSKIVFPKNGTENLSKNSSQIINFFKYNLQQGIYNHGSVCFHKTVYKTVGFYDETIDFAEDIDFNIRANSKFKLAYSNTIEMSYLMQSENQLTLTSILNKRLPDFDQYETLANENKSLKKYLDFERYVLAKHVKTDGNHELYIKISSEISIENLNLKQLILLKLPAFLLRFLSKMKVFFIQKGWKFTSY
jgi:glycosyltransferase involved in cell wall biosynthesis